MARSTTPAMATGVPADLDTWSAAAARPSRASDQMPARLGGGQSRRIPNRAIAFWRRPIPSLESGGPHPFRFIMIAFAAGGRLHASLADGRPCGQSRSRGPRCRHPLPASLDPRATLAKTRANEALPEKLVDLQAC